MYSIIKILMSALIIAGVTEMAKKFPAYGGIVAALPIVSLLSIVWLSVQGEKREVISQFTLGVLYGLPHYFVTCCRLYLFKKFPSFVYKFIHRSSVLGSVFGASKDFV
jgi:hypothetical protein